MVSRWVWMFLLKLNEDNRTFVLIFVFRVVSEQSTQQFILGAMEC